MSMLTLVHGNRSEDAAARTRGRGQAGRGQAGPGPGGAGARRGRGQAGPGPGGAGVGGQAGPKGRGSGKDRGEGQAARAQVGVWKAYLVAAVTGFQAADGGVAGLTAVTGRTWTMQIGSPARRCRSSTHSTSTGKP
jgi:hypothetical protein